MNITPDIITIISSVTPLAVVAFIAWKEYRSGESALTKKIREDYKERNQQLEERVTDLETEHHEHSVQIGKLETIVEEKDKQIKRYEEIFANRNPEMTVLLTEIRDFMKSIHTQNNIQTKMLEEVKKQ